MPKVGLWPGVSGYVYNGDVYCPQCAEDMGLVDLDKVNEGEEVLVKMFAGIGCSPMLSDEETDLAQHCGRMGDCVNAVPAETYDGMTGEYLVGERLETTVLSVFPYEEVVYPDEIEQPDEITVDAMPFAVYDRETGKRGEVLAVDEPADVVVVEDMGYVEAEELRWSGGRWLAYKL